MYLLCICVFAVRMKLHWCTKQPGSSTWPALVTSGWLENEKWLARLSVKLQMVRQALTSSFSFLLPSSLSVSSSSSIQPANWSLKRRKIHTAGMKHQNKPVTCREEIDQTFFFLSPQVRHRLPLLGPNGPSFSKKMKLEELKWSKLSVKILNKCLSWESLMAETNGMIWQDEDAKNTKSQQISLRCD